MYEYNDNVSLWSPDASKKNTLSRIVEAVSKAGGDKGFFYKYKQANASAASL